MNVTAQKFQSQYAPVCKSLAWSNHRTTLPQSRIRSTAPSEREPGRGAYHSTCRPETATLRAIFIAPTKGGWHSTGRSETPTLAGDFHRPYATLMILAYTIHRTTLPQSALRADSSLREGAGEGCVPFIVPPGSRKVAGDFHRPYERAVPFSRLCSRWPR